MARCSSCNLLCAVEPQIDNVDVDCDGEHTVSVSVDISLLSQCCSDTTGSATAEGSYNFELEHADGCEGGEWEAEENGYEETDWFTGKGRGMRHYYGASVTYRIHCSECDVEDEQTVDVGEMASAFS